MSFPKRLICVPALALAFLAAGCKESTAPAGDPTSLVPAVQTLDASLSQNAVFQSLAALSNTVVFAAAPVPLSVTGTAGAVAAARRSLALIQQFGGRTGNAIQALFPANVLGKTFVWDTASGGRYRIMDSSLTGAPSNGVRFILYQVDTATLRPRLPLTTTGHVDLTDVSTPQANALHILIQVGTQTAGDYTITNVRTTTTDTLRADGYIVDVVGGGTPVTFDLKHALNLSDSSLVTTYVAAGNGATVTMSTAISGASGAESLTLDWLISKAGSVEVVGTITPAATDVQFKVNGSVWATASGVAGGPVSITGANGRTLSAPELAALGAILQGFVSIFAHLSAVFAPAALVFS